MAVALVGLTALIGCGKRGDPRPPLRPIPAQIVDLAVRRSSERVQLSFTVPAANSDGTQPATVDRVEVFARTQPAGGAALTAAQLVADPANLISRVLVRPLDMPDVPGVSTAVAAPPRPGEVATVVDRATTGTGGTGTRYYVAVGLAGGGRGRPGAASTVAALPLGELPTAPAGVSVTHDETRIILSWQPAVTGQQYRVLRGDQSLDLATATMLTPSPIAETRFELPVEFGRQACFSIQAMSVSGSVVTEGTPSPPQCLVPTDTYAPAIPSGLQLIQEDGGITLIWSAVAAPDLAGYIVLRGGQDAATLQPLFTTPLAATTYKDTTAQAGMSYTYAIYAVDRTVPPNASQPSERQTVTVR